MITHILKNENRFSFPAVNCKVGEWGPWSPCSSTCGDNAVQKRRRKILRKPKHGGIDCPIHREKRRCVVPMCTKTDVSSR